MVLEEVLGQSDCARAMRLGLTSFLRVLLERDSLGLGGDVAAAIEIDYHLRCAPFGKRLGGEVLLSLPPGGVAIADLPPLSGAVS
ncbi:hypothetical protein ACH4A8_39295 [Streptomyces vietnamensis]|uniref:hypothetical protein n=1 Tax=Streptomyces vietnamensis TaxID=362257 RepID=UPI0037BD34F6